MNRSTVGHWLIGAVSDILAPMKTRFSLTQN